MTVCQIVWYVLLSFWQRGRFWVFVLLRKCLHCFGVLACWFYWLGVPLYIYISKKESFFLESVVR